MFSNCYEVFLNILIVSQYFWPEPFIINDLVLHIKAQGHTVSIYTGKPNYPDGAIYSGYSSSQVHEEIYGNGIDVFRVPLRPRKNGRAKNLFINYLSFVFSGLRYSFVFLKNKQFDAILVFCPSPITAAIPAIFLKWLTKAHLAIWVQDLWPESLSATGYIKNRGALYLVGRLVRWIYACADTLLVQSQAFEKPVLKYVSQEKIVYYPNSHSDTSLEPHNDSLIPDDLLLELERNFCLVFAGNLGIAQSMETLVEASERLTHLSDCKIVLVGSGSMSDWIEQEIAAKGLNNLILAGRFPSSAMPSFFSRAAGLLVSLKRDEILTYTIPCKIQAYLAAGRPVIAALDGEGARIINLAGAGFSGPAEDSCALANNIERLYHMPIAERDKCGVAGRDYFLNHFEMGRQSLRLIEILDQKINTKGTLN